MFVWEIGSELWFNCCWKNCILCITLIKISLIFKSLSLLHVDPSTGHYPGAVNIPFPNLFNAETKTLKSVDELKKGDKLPLKWVKQMKFSFEMLDLSYFKVIFNRLSILYTF